MSTPSDDELAEIPGRRWRLPFRCAVHGFSFAVAQLSNLARNLDAF
jgi:hypothetical protein